MRSVAGIDPAIEKDWLEMEVNLIFKIAAVGILVTILCQVLKHSGREEHSFLLSLSALILIMKSNIYLIIATSWPPD